MATSTNRSGFPTLEPAYIIKGKVGDLYPVGDLYTGSSLLHAVMASGSITTVPGFEPHLDGEIIFGGDSIVFDPDKKHARINVQGLAKTTEGVLIGFKYTGALHINEEVQRIFDQAPNMQTVAFGQISTAHTFEVSDAKYQDLVNFTWVGNGRFIVDDGSLKVESRISKMIPSRDMD